MSTRASWLSRSATASAPRTTSATSSTPSTSSRPSRSEPLGPTREAAMKLPDIELDDRRFQDLVNEARLRVARSCPEWTEHNVSDPGITLIELFAWMTEMTIYRLNRVPDKLHLKLLELLGIRLDGPNAAHTDLRFRLPAPPTNPIELAARTTEI